MWCCSDFNSAWCPLPCSLWNGSLKRDFLDIHLTTFFGVHNLGNTSAMTGMFFLKCLEFNLAFKNEETSSENVFFSQLALNCL